MVDAYMYVFESSERRLNASIPSIVEPSHCYLPWSRHHPSTPSPILAASTTRRAQVHSSTRNTVVDVFWQVEHIANLTIIVKCSVFFLRRRRAFPRRASRSRISVRGILCVTLGGRWSIIGASTFAMAARPHVPLAVDRWKCGLNWGLRFRLN